MRNSATTTTRASSRKSRIRSCWTTCSKTPIPTRCCSKWMSTGQTVMGKASPVDYFKKYPGRFRLLHIKDRREIGQSGMVGFDAIFANAGPPAWRTSSSRSKVRATTTSCAASRMRRLPARSAFRHGFFSGQITPSGSVAHIRPSLRTAGCRHVVFGCRRGFSAELSLMLRVEAGTDTFVVYAGCGRYGRKHTLKNRTIERWSRFLCGNTRFELVTSCMPCKAL